jgi:hypothetical protein
MRPLTNLRDAHTESRWARDLTRADLAFLAMLRISHARMDHATHQDVTIDDRRLLRSFRIRVTQ